MKLSMFVVLWLCAVSALAQQDQMQEFLEVTSGQRIQISVAYSSVPAIYFLKAEGLEGLERFQKIAGIKEDEAPNNEYLGSLVGSTISQSVVTSVQRTADTLMVVQELSDTSAESPLHLKVRLEYRKSGLVEFWVDGSNSTSHYVRVE